MVGGARERGQWTARELLALERLATELLTGDDAGLATEVAAARLALLRVLRDEDDAVRLADGVAKAAAVVFKALQMERRDGDEGMAPLATASTRILTELGLGIGEQGTGWSDVGGGGDGSGAE